jgi:hypothetical protein
LAFNPISGDLYVAEAWNRRVQVFDPDGVPLRAFTVNMWFTNRQSPNRPYLAVSPDGTLIYVTDMDDRHRVVAYNLEGLPVFSFNQPDDLEASVLGCAYRRAWRWMNRAACSWWTPASPKCSSSRRRRCRAILRPCHPATSRFCLDQRATPRKARPSRFRLLDQSGGESSDAGGGMGSDDASPSRAKVNYTHPRLSPGCCLLRPSKGIAPLVPSACQEDYRVR